MGSVSLIETSRRSEMEWIELNFMLKNLPCIGVKSFV